MFQQQEIFLAFWSSSKPFAHLLHWITGTVQRESGFEHYPDCGASPRTLMEEFFEDRRDLQVPRGEIAERVPQNMDRQQLR